MHRHRHYDTHTHILYMDTVRCTKFEKCVFTRLSRNPDKRRKCSYAHSGSRADEIVRYQVYTYCAQNTHTHPVIVHTFSIYHGSNFHFKRCK